MKTQEGFFKPESNAPGPAQQNNFFGRPNTEGAKQFSNTATSGFGMTAKVQGDLINDPNNNLNGEMENCSKEDLKERLIVAEKVMKSLFQRNKALEDKLQNDQKTSASTTENKSSEGPVVVCSNCSSNGANKSNNQEVLLLQ